MNLIKEVTAKIKELRVGRGYDQIHLAKKLKTGQGAVSRLEAGQDLKLSTLQKVAKALGYKVTINFTEEKNSK